MKRPWIKLWRNLLNDEKIAFIIRRYGHDCITFWIGILTKCEDGLLLEDEDVFADLCMLEETRYKEIRGVFIKRGLLVEENGRLRVSNWEEYQVAESTDRVRQHREAKKQESAAPEPAAGEAPEAPAASGAVTDCNASVTTCNGDVTNCNADETTEGEGELEGEVEREGEGESACAPPSPVFQNPSPEIASPDRIVADWIDALSSQTGVQATPPPKAREWAAIVQSTVKNNMPLAQKLRAEYFSHWRELWFAVAKGDMKKEPFARAPDFDFRAYCTNIVTLAGRLSEQAPPVLARSGRVSEPLPSQEEREQTAAMIKKMAAGTPFGAAMVHKELV